MADATESLVPVGVTIDNTLGALFVGFAVACCVYGVLMSQMYTYFVNYPMDRPVYKFIVRWPRRLLETADQVLIGQIYYHYGVSSFGDPLTLIEGTQICTFHGSLHKHLNLRLASAFALRVWRFSKHNFWIAGTILSLGGLGLSIGAWVPVVRFSSFLNRWFSIHRQIFLGTASLSVGVLTDIVIAAALCYFLNKLRTGYHKSDSLASSLIRYAINTGALTSVVSITTVILYNIMPNNLIFIGVFFILSKRTCYLLTYPSRLNTRRVVAGKGTDKQGTTNDTNMFHLGTRVPSAGPAALDDWEVYSAGTVRDFHKIYQLLKFIMSGD
ncbi:hypothetical protein BDP27DRAFT_1224764 [Rhodocollybia butyracea]|uniref:DUF6534 domain-containing protein n=1 Tax=Rhodocollybia butyracea TaxID=206335 RepID=A0A9P5PUG0_9AGAR|nr:hypothetical protein BDP27DRAFT_1224764 [Rhodocollybia butyracea]